MHLLEAARSIPLQGLHTSSLLGTVQERRVTISASLGTVIAFTIIPYSPKTEGMGVEDMHTHEATKLYFTI